MDNEKEFDLSDILVKTQSIKYFTNNIKTVTVPYDVFQSYLRAFYEKDNKFVDANKDGKWDLSQGKGISIGSFTDKDKVGTMEKTYFLYESSSEEGQLGTLISGAMTESELLAYLATISPDQTIQVFAGYTFKQENDGYHMDGFIVNLNGTYTAPTPETNPDGGSGGSSSGGGSGSSNPGTTTPVVTISGDPVALADMIDQAAVEILDGPVALAASVPDDVIIDDEGVPLADSIPQTGDNAVPVAPVAATGITALLAAFFMGKRKKED